MNKRHNQRELALPLPGTRSFMLKKPLRWLP